MTVPPEDDRLPLNAAPLPESQGVPQALIDRWYGLDSTAYLTLKLTRQDLDLLFAAIDKTLVSQEHFRQAMMSWTSGDVDLANERNHLAAHTSIEARNALRGLFSAIMASAEVGE